jgi:hemoglobin
MEVSDVSEVFAAVESDETLFYALVEAFYSRVEADPPLRALYPADLAPGKQHLAWFLIQRFGGPERFSAQRGAPMLRRRHAGFAITSDQAMRWFQNMSAAIDDVAALAPYKGPMLRYFQDAALFLVNRDERKTASRLPLAVPNANSPESDS